jgi:hypothetical protein
MWQGTINVISAGEIKWDVERVDAVCNIATMKDF